MALPVTIPNTFANATSSIPLSQLDANFSTLANAVNGINSGSETLANLKASNVTITGGVISNVTLDNVTVDVETLSNVTINGGNVTVTNMTATTGNVNTINVTTINARDGTASMSLANSTGILSLSNVLVTTAGTSAAPSITTTGDTNTGIFFPAADTIAFAEGGAEAMRIDASGNLGLGVTPSAWGTFKAFDLFSTLGASLASTGGSMQLGMNFYYDGSNYKYKDTGHATRYEQLGGGAGTTSHAWFTAPSGTAGNTISFTQAMTLTSGGNLLVGTTTSGGKGIVVGSQYGGVDLSGGGGSYAQWGGGYGMYPRANVGLGIGSSVAISFEVNGGTEAARITSGGYFKASPTGSYKSSTGTYHELNSDTNGDYGCWIRNVNATSPYVLAVEMTNAAPNNGTVTFIRGGDNTAARFYLYSNGGLANYQANDVNLSDERVKKDIIPAPSYWDKIKGIEIVHFKYKDQTHDDDNVGVIAQQVEQVAPEFVNEEGWGETPEDGKPLKSIYTSDMYHAAIKALQEAMTRIEALEAEVAALKGQ